MQREIIFTSNQPFALTYHSSLITFKNKAFQQHILSYVPFLASWTGKYFSLDSFTSPAQFLQLLHSCTQSVNVHVLPSIPIFIPRTESHSFSSSPICYQAVGIYSSQPIRGSKLATLFCLTQAAVCPKEYKHQSRIYIFSSHSSFPKALNIPFFPTLLHPHIPTSNAVIENLGNLLVVSFYIISFCFRSGYNVVSNSYHYCYYCCSYCYNQLQL